MTKFKKIILGIKLLFSQPSLINLIINSDERWWRFLNKKHPNMPQLPSIKLNDFGAFFDEKLAVFSFLGGGSLPMDIMLLKTICKQFKDCSYFEIGTWRGESVINVADVAKDCFTLNLSKKEILSMNLPEKYADLHGYFSKGKENITHLFGNSFSYDFKKLNKKFDVIFIDGGHDYEAVKNDTQKIFKHLTHENSVVIWHDYAYNPESVRPEVLAGILDGIPKNKREKLYHVSNTMCAIYVPKTIKSKIEEYPLKPENNFSVLITQD